MNMSDIESDLMNFLGYKFYLVLNGYFDETGFIPHSRNAVEV